MTRRVVIVSALTALGLVVLVTGPTGGLDAIISVQAPQATAVIVVKVIRDGLPLPLTRHEMNADSFCAAARSASPPMSEVGADGLGRPLNDVVVFVRDGISGVYPPPEKPAILDQKNCMYSPRVLAIMAGQPLEIINSDATFHNLHVLPRANSEFNVAMLGQEMKLIRMFARPEDPFLIKCDVHPGMTGYIGVFGHPFFGVSDEQGEVQLSNLPNGTFGIETWHEHYGVRRQTLSLGVGEVRHVTMTY